MMGRAFTTDETRGAGADALFLKRVERRGLYSRMAGDAEIIVIGEADEMVPVSLRVVARLIDLNKKRVVFFEVGFAREPETFGRIVCETFYAMCQVRLSICSSPALRES